MFSKRIEKMCDYVNLFSVVNRELITSDKQKVAKHKKTNRYPISTIFIEVTETMEKILEIIKEIKVVSITEIKHKEGVDLPTDPLEKERSLYEHFNVIDETHRNYLDLREYVMELEDSPVKDMVGGPKT